MRKRAVDEKSDLSISILNMHGIAYANFSVNECDLLPEAIRA